jgi:hypothetical protein
VDLQGIFRAFVLRKVTIDEQKENRSKGLAVKGLGRLFSAE